MVFKFAWFVEHAKGYQHAKRHWSRLSGSSLTKGLQKHNDDVIMTPFHTFGIPHFVKLIISYQRTKFQIPQLSESIFTEVFIRHPEKPLWRHYDVT